MFSWNNFLPSHHQVINTKLLKGAVTEICLLKWTEVYFLKQYGNSKRFFSPFCCAVAFCHFKWLHTCTFIVLEAQSITEEWALNLCGWQKPWSKKDIRTLSKGYDGCFTERISSLHCTVEHKINIMARDVRHAHLQSRLHKMQLESIFSHWNCICITHYIGIVFNVLQS